MAATPRKTYPELTALATPVQDADVLAAYRSPGPLRRLTASALAEYIAGSVASPPPLLLSGTLTNQGNSPYWTHVRASDGILFVLVTNDLTLRSYSLADPAAPSFLGTVSVGSGGGSSADLTIKGNYAYVTDQNTLTLRVVDITTPASMTVVGTLVYDASGGGGGGRSDITPDGQYLCIGGPESGTNANRAVVVDVSTPASPTVVGRAASAGSTHRGVACISDTHFGLCSRDDKTMLIYSIATPSAPAVVGSYVTPSGFGSVSTPCTYDTASATLYYGSFGTGGLLALDVSTPTAPTLKSAVITPPNAEQISLGDDGRVLIGCRNINTLTLVDGSDPSNLSLIDTLVLPGTTTPGVSYYNGFAHVTCAGDSNNGKVFTVAVEPTLEDAFETLQAAITSTAAGAAGLAANTFAGKQTITPAAALALTSDTASITFGTTSPDILSRVGAAAFSWPGVSISLGNVIAYSSGSMVRAKAGPATAFWAVEFDAFGELRLGAGTTAADVRIGRRAANVWGGISTHISCSTAGFGFRVAEGSNAKQGVATLTAGSVVVSNTAVTANSRIFLTPQDNNTAGAVRVSARTAATSFTITSNNGADTGVIAYEIFEPA